MLRTFFVWSCIALSTLVLGFLAFATYPFDPRGRTIHHYAKAWGKVALFANGVRVKVEGLEHLRRGSPYVFMSNHQGSYDVFTLLGYLPFQFKWLAKKELFSVPFLGWTMAVAGYISIDREGTRETVKAMNRAAEKIREGMSVLIFPEGSRSPDGSIQPFKKGGFSLAIKSKVPIVPIAIAGTRSIMPKDKLMLKPGQVRVRVGMPFETAYCSMKDRNSLIEKVAAAIFNNIKLISQA